MSAIVRFARQHRPCPATERPPQRAQCLEIGRSSAAPLTGSSLSRRLTVDGVDNKANGRFCRLAGARHQPSGIPCFNPLFCLGLIRVRAKSASPLTRAVSMFPSRRFDATSFGSRPVAAAPQEVAVAAQLQGWMLAWGIRGACQIISEHFWSRSALSRCLLRSGNGSMSGKANESAVKKVLRHRLGEAGRPRGRGKGSTRGRVKAPRTSAGAG